MSDFLKKVIFRLDFLGDIKLSGQVVDNFKRVVSDDFPKFEPREQVNMQMHIDQTEKIIKEKRSKAFYFHNDTTNNSITLQPDSIIFEIKNYNTYSEFRELVKKVIQNLENENSSAKLSRIGLRYINQIIFDDGNPFEWSDFVKEPLLNSLNFIEKRNELARMMGIIELNRSEYFIRFTYGWFNSEFPNPIAKKEFALDYDCYSKNEIDISEVISQVDLYHTAIKDLFQYSIENSLKKLIEGDKDV